MGRHSRSGENPPTKPAGRWNSARARPQPVAPGGPGEETDTGLYSSTLDDSGHIPLVSGPEVEPSTPPSTAPGNVLIRAADPTQAIPRIQPDVQAPWAADPDSTTSLVGVEATGASDTEADVDTAWLSRDEADDHAPDAAGAAADTADTADTATDTDTDTDDTDAADAADAAAARHRRPGWVWAGLAVFWLLALGAGLVTLASLGAPHYLCTGTASTGLACENAGTAIAAVLTVALIVAVGTVSVLAIEARTEARTAWRWLGIGIVVLIVVAGCGYLLIRTIGG